MKIINLAFVQFIILASFISGPVFALSIAEQLAHAALQRTKVEVFYNGAYVKINYPNGDVPENTGVCTDVVIRSYRVLGIDLQQLIHEDMKENFSVYPSKRIWGLTRPDTNIDHRRVPNLQAYFSRFATTLAITKNAADYKVGDLVTWMLPGNLPHIGIVAKEAPNNTPTNVSAPSIVHNIGAGPKLEDMLFDYTITGHYRFPPRLK